MKDIVESGEVGNVNMNKVDEKIVVLFGVDVVDVQIIDMVVNLFLNNIYLVV